MIDLPPIPFEVYYQEYNKTVHVVASCAPDTYKSVTLYIDETQKLEAKIVFNEVNKAFDTPGIVRIQICRIKETKK